MENTLRELIYKPLDYNGFILRGSRPLKHSLPARKGGTETSGLLANWHLFGRGIETRCGKPPSGLSEAGKVP
jgi:hypothetical protein